jgi:hypothetical protein
MPTGPRSATYSSARAFHRRLIGGRINRVHTLAFSPGSVPLGRPSLLTLQPCTSPAYGQRNSVLRASRTDDYVKGHGLLVKDWERTAVLAVVLSNLCALVVQWIEHRRPKAGVVGSNPTEGDYYKKVRPGYPGNRTFLG